MADVEMKQADAKPAKDAEEKKKEEQKPIPISPVAEIKSNVLLIDRAVTTLEPRFTHRVLRTLTALRKRIDDSVLRNAIESIYPKGLPMRRSGPDPFPFTSYFLLDHAVKKNLLAWLPTGPSSTGQEMDVDTSSKSSQAELVPEAEMYLRLLILLHLLASEDTQEKALELANETAEKMQALNRRSMDAIAAKVWYAVDRAYELAGELSDARPYVASE